MESEEIPENILRNRASFDNDSGSIRNVILGVKKIPRV